jgi:hypothetical protein
MTVVSVLLDMSLNRRDTILFDNGICIVAFFPNRHCTICLLHTGQLSFLQCNGLSELLLLDNSLDMMLQGHFHYY